jgi:osomolarity two-component system response regulator SKN7
MPKLDGCSATSMIRQFNRITPIVAVTANVKPSHVMAYYTSGMTDVLGKPLAKGEVMDILDVRSDPATSSAFGADRMSY